MRNEFYGDRKDLWKWTVVLNEAGDREVLYIAMYRPDQKKSQHRDVREDVALFFQGEASVLNSERKCSRIQQLSDRITCFLDICNAKQSDSYFMEISKAIISRDRAAACVVFVDPDTGVRERVGPEHITPKQLGTLWKSMRAGDTLLVYQHYARKKAGPWLDEKKESIAQALCPAPKEISDKRHSGVCFLIANKPNHSCD